MILQKNLTIDLNNQYKIEFLNFQLGLHNSSLLKFLLFSIINMRYAWHKRIHDIPKFCLIEIIIAKSFRWENTVHYIYYK